MTLQASIDELRLVLRPCVLVSPWMGERLSAVAISCSHHYRVWPSKLLDLQGFWWCCCLVAMLLHWANRPWKGFVVDGVGHFWAKTISWVFWFGLVWFLLSKNCGDPQQNITYIVYKPPKEMYFFICVIVPHTDPPKPRPHQSNAVMAGNHHHTHNSWGIKGGTQTHKR